MSIYAMWLVLIHVRYVRSFSSDSLTCVQLVQQPAEPFVGTKLQIKIKHLNMWNDIDEGIRILNNLKADGVM